MERLAEDGMAAWACGGDGDGNGGHGRRSRSRSRRGRAVAQSGSYSYSYSYTGTYSHFVLNIPLNDFLVLEIRPYKLYVFAST